MKTKQVFQVDAFTRKKFQGNPAGVVLHADTLSDQEMQHIARELNNSETAFVLQGQAGHYDLHIRYFTPTTEVPSCGHATVAALYVYAHHQQAHSATYRIKTGAGILTVEVQENEGEYEVTVEQGRIVFEKPFEPDQADQIIQALGAEQKMIESKAPIQVVSTGHSKVIIPMKSRQHIDTLKPDLSKLTEISREIKCNGYFVFTILETTPNYTTYGRMFAPAIGIPEDPVTGNANGPLGAYLIQHKQIILSSEVFEFTARQGDAIGRPGSMLVAVTVTDGKPDTVKITGSAIIVFSTEITL